MIEAFLTSHNLFGYVDGTIPCPDQKFTTDTAVTDNPSYIPWISNDAHIRMLIIATVSENSYQHIQGKTSRDVWLSLKRAYAPVTASHEFTLKTQLLRITMKGDEKPTDYLSRVHEYATALANIGEPMKDKDLVMLTIAGLRDEYNVIKGNLLTRLPPVRFNELHGLLCDHDYVFTKNLPPQAFLAPTAPTSQPQPAPTLDPLQQQLQSIQLTASQLGYQLNPLPASSLLWLSVFQQQPRWTGISWFLSRSLASWSQQSPSRQPWLPPVLLGFSPKHRLWPLQQVWDRSSTLPMSESAESACFRTTSQFFGPL
ncbi:hypothetical protein L6452_42781 [Arctium lappa]|uniref:Uncharacterized protein n=1 Tax=Arctium lappa TaxID=4217 RepID=A0ACB8XKE4_ARCLA|nr:hypothetical protein L6452_42781 [Arctium lappa]